MSEMIERAKAAFIDSMSDGGCVAYKEYLAPACWRVDGTFDLDAAMRAAIAAIEAAGYVIAPREPTEAMREAVAEAEQQYDDYEPIPWEFAWPVALDAATKAG